MVNTGNRIGQWGVSDKDIPSEEDKLPSASENSGPDIVEKVENTLYFYAEIYRDNILKLNKELALLQNNLYYQSIVTNNKPANIYLHIQSYGGSIFSGLSAMDMILKSKIDVITIVDGCAASAATLLSVAGSTRYIKEHSYILIHQLSSIFWGNYEQLKDDMENSSKFMTMVKNIYKEHTKIPMKKLNEILKHDLWFTAKEALQYGLVDDII